MNQEGEKRRRASYRQRCWYANGKAPHGEGLFAFSGEAFPAGLGAADWNSLHRDKLLLAPRENPNKPNAE